MARPGPERSYRFGVFLVIAAVSLAAIDRAQQATPTQSTSPQQAPVFRAGINLVQVDVSVLDKSGAPIRGLKPEDFVVRENDKPQSIDQLSEIVAPTLVPPTAPWMTTVSSDVATNEFQDRRLIAIVLDDAMMPSWSEGIKNAKAIAKSTINRMSPTDLAAVIFTRDTTLSQEFTSDKVRLLAAVDKLTAGYAYSADRDLSGLTGSGAGGGSGGGGGGKSGGGGAASSVIPATKPPNPDEYWYKQSVQVVTNVAEDLVAIPQRRKLLVYIGIGVPYDQGAGSNLAMGPGGDIAERELMIGIREKLEHAINRAQRANVTVYGFEPAGQMGLESFFTSNMAHNVGPNPVVPPKTIDPTVAADVATSHRSFVQTMAENTGGRSVINTGNFTPGLDRMFQENESYYLIGYRQAVPQKPGEYRRIDIKVNRPGAEVRSRHINYVEAGDDEAGGGSDAREAMAGLLPNPSTPMRITAIPFALPPAIATAPTTPKTATAAVAIVLGLTDEAPAARRVEHIEMVESAFSSDGTPHGTQTQTADVTIRPSEQSGAGAPVRAAFEVLSVMPIKPGRQQIRLAAENTTNGKVGSVFIDVDVPDFVNAPLSLSGVALDETPRMWYGPADAFASLLDAVPTVHRNFSADGHVRAVLRVYQGGKAPLSTIALKTTITDDHNHVAVTADTPLTPDQFGSSRSYDVHYDLPLGTLTPAGYLLTFEAAAPGSKTPLRRDVIFSVR